MIWLGVVKPLSPTRCTLVSSLDHSNSSRNPRTFQLVLISVYFLAIVAERLSAWKFIFASAQSDNFAGAVPCPSNDSIEGYVNIAELQNDFQNELEAIRQEPGVQRPDYIFILCPGTTFDLSTLAEGMPLKPLLDRTVIRCG
jgi:hypothetical protein